jgi:hypothetical protein
MKHCQEPKYSVNCLGEIVNRKTGTVIPEDEPVFLLRAKDAKAMEALEYYSQICDNPDHYAEVVSRLNSFVDFSKEHPERMREPG